MKITLMAESAEDMKAKVTELALLFGVTSSKPLHVLHSEPEVIKPLVQEKHVVVQDTVMTSNPLVSEGSAVYKDDSKDQELDSSGIPWDNRIHMVGKPKLSSGVWKKRRGLKPEYVAEVESELKNKLKGQLPVSNTSVASPLNASVGQVANPFVKSEPVSNMFKSPVENSIGYSHTLVSFKANLITIISQAINDKKINAEFLEQALAHYKHSDIFKLKEDDKSVEDLYNVMVQHQIITKV